MMKLLRDAGHFAEARVSDDGRLVDKHGAPLYLLPPDPEGTCQGALATMRRVVREETGGRGGVALSTDVMATVLQGLETIDSIAELLYTALAAEADDKPHMVLNPGQRAGLVGGVELIAKQLSGELFAALERKSLSDEATGSAR